MVVAAHRLHVAVEAPVPVLEDVRREAADVRVFLRLVVEEEPVGAEVVASGAGLVADLGVEVVADAGVADVVVEPAGFVVGVEEPAGDVGAMPSAGHRHLGAGRAGDEREQLAVGAGLQRRVDAVGTVEVLGAVRVAGGLAVDEDGADVRPAELALHPRHEEVGRWSDHRVGAGVVGVARLHVEHADVVVAGLAADPRRRRGSAPRCRPRSRSGARRTGRSAATRRTGRSTSSRGRTGASRGRTVRSG